MKSKLWFFKKCLSLERQQRPVPLARFFWRFQKTSESTEDGRLPVFHHQAEDAKKTNGEFYRKTSGGMISLEKI